MAIVVRIELWPGGDESRKSIQGTLVLANDGTGSVTVGNYDVTLLNRIGVASRHGRVEKWPRKAKSIWGLIRTAMDSVYPGVHERVAELELEDGE